MTYFVVFLVVVIIVLVYGLHRALMERESLAARLSCSQEEHALERVEWQAMYKILNSSVGGVHKRIDEIREITETIQRYHPELFKVEPGLVHWLSASDEFLCRLRDTAMPIGRDSWEDEMRNIFVGTGRTNAIYEQVRHAI